MCAMQLVYRQTHILTHRQTRKGSVRTQGQSDLSLLFYRRTYRAGYTPQVASLVCVCVFSSLLPPYIVDGIFAAYFCRIIYCAIWWNSLTFELSIFFNIQFEELYDTASTMEFLQYVLFRSMFRNNRFLDWDWLKPNLPQSVHLLKLEAGVHHFCLLKNRLKVRLPYFVHFSISPIG